ncbi:WD40-repeat-containing domain protein [Coniella lustricola]|uniref:ASTRA-associated protein 1 n=1 Tax=Coniella lustricola TaxID=2025994 RepID=A0A2T3ANT3_9PEZI|nr:WD40-repeat-containing domain protein [Coniella lustricola]
MAADNVELPPQPKAILRGHKAQIHAVVFIRSNERLLTGDADGFVAAWDLTTMRPRAVWQAHDSTILGLAGWGTDKVITHGRDNKLIVWRLSAADESSMSTSLPLEVAPEPRSKPWMLHMLPVNTMNFCAFACSPASPASALASTSHSAPQTDLLVAVPNTLASEAIDVYTLPSQSRIHTVRLGGEHGMAMALRLTWLSNVLTLIVGYEDGLTVVTQLGDDGSWHVIYRVQCHKQPVLSLDIAPSLEYFLTSSADATIAKHPLPTPQREAEEVPSYDSGQASHHTDEPEKMAASLFETDAREPGQDTPVSLLSAALASRSRAADLRVAKSPIVETQPLRVINTKHSGQQGLRLRSDGRVFATAGWDSKVRVYSAKTMREVAVLKWHPVGCFTVAFADITTANFGNETAARSESSIGEDASEHAVAPRALDMTVKGRRIHQAKTAHWLAAGSKDGKVSLWDIF